MTLPVINYKFNGNEEAKSLATVMDQKLAPLEKYFKTNAKIVCDVEFEKIGSHQNGRIFRVEANLSIDGQLHRAEATEESFEKAIDEVRDELDKTLRRNKDKEHTLDKDAGRELKDMLLGE
jgi:ribosomal subunit interface protein